MSASTTTRPAVDEKPNNRCNNHDVSARCCCCCDCFDAGACPLAGRRPTLRQAMPPPLSENCEATKCCHQTWIDGYTLLLLLLLLVLLLRSLCVCVCVLPRSNLIACTSFGWRTSFEVERRRLLYNFKLMFGSFSIIGIKAGLMLFYLRGSFATTSKECLLENGFLTNGPKID